MDHPRTQTGSPSRRRPARWDPPSGMQDAVLTPRLRLEAADDTAGAGRNDRYPDGDARVGDPDAPTSHRRRLLDAHDRTPVGAITLSGIDPATGAAAVRIAIDPAHRRRGLAAEALTHLFSAALAPVADGGWGLSRLHMTAVGSDTAARGLARRLGIGREMRRRQDVHVAGVGVDDTYGWAVLADEWDPGGHRMRRATSDPDVGVGPHPLPWPDDDRLDPLLLRDGDRRNVADRYRYWRHEHIVADLAARAHPFHVAIENWRHDSNIGTVVRNANAFGAAGVHIVGRRSWNRRGAMVTDRYLDVRHHDDAAALARWAAERDLALIGIDNLPGSVSLHDHPPPRRCVLLMGQEGPGLSSRAREAVTQILHIPQFGSTRSINAGVASGIAMASWVQTHAGAPPGPPHA